MRTTSIVLLLLHSLVFQLNADDSSSTTVAAEPGRIKCVSPETNLTDGTCGCKPCDSNNEKLYCGTDGDGNAKYFLNQCNFAYHNCKDRKIIAGGDCAKEFGYCKDSLTNNDGIMECTCKTECSSTEAKIACGEKVAGQTIFFFNQCNLEAEQCSTKKEINAFDCGTQHTPDKYCNTGLVNVDRKATCNCAKCDDNKVDVVCAGTETFKWYFNECHMKEIRCREKTDHTINKAKCNDISYCTSIENKNGLAVCECEDCKDDSVDPVCGILNGNHIMFLNLCHLKNRQCKEKVKIEIEQDTSVCGRANCDKYNVSENWEAVCHCEPCTNQTLSAVCGNIVGTDIKDPYYNDCHRKAASCKSGKHIAVVELTECKNHTCSETSDSKITENGFLKCECPKCEEGRNETKEICDSNGNSFKNMCFLKQSHCKAGKTILDATPCVNDTTTAADGSGTWVWWIVGIVVVIAVCASVIAGAILLWKYWLKEKYEAHKSKNTGTDAEKGAGTKGAKVEGAETDGTATAVTVTGGTVADQALPEGTKVDGKKPDEKKPDGKKPDGKKNNKKSKETKTKNKKKGKKNKGGSKSTEQSSASAGTPQGASKEGVLQGVVPAQGASKEGVPQGTAPAQPVAGAPKV